MYRWQAEPLAGIWFDAGAFEYSALCDNDADATGDAGMAGVCSDGASAVVPPGDTDSRLTLPIDIQRMYQAMTVVRAGKFHVSRTESV